MRRMERERTVVIERAHGMAQQHRACYLRVRGGPAGHGGFTIGVSENTSLFNKVQRGRLIREGPGRAINILIQWRWEVLPESQLQAAAFKENE